MLWDERYRNHEVWRAVERARLAMNEANLPDAESERQALDYAGTVLELLEQRRHDTDGREVSPAMLSNTLAAVNAFATYIEYAVTTQYTWTQVVASADDVVTALAQWPPMKMARWLSGINAAVEGFQRRALDAADGVERRAEEIRESLLELELGQGRLGESVAKEKQRISEAIANFTAESDEAVREWTTAQESQITSRVEKWDEAILAAEVQATTHNETMAAYEAKSKKVLEAVGVNSTATDFGTYANEQRAAANRWRQGAAVVFVLAGVWFIASSFPWFANDAEIWESAIARIGVTAAVAGVGLYAARESSQHRRQERRSKQVQLVLTALEPFIANLDVEEQDRIRVQSAEAIFVLRDTQDANSDDAALNGVLGLANSLVAKIPDRT